MEQDTEKIIGLNRNVFFLGVTSLFNDFSSEMIAAVFPVFFTTVLRAGAASLGLVEGVSDGFSNLIKIYSGDFSDKLQRKKLWVVAGYAFSVITRPFYLFASRVTSAFGLRFLDRVGKGVRDAPRDALISLSSPSEEMGKSFGYHRAMDTIGAILGPLTAYLILKNFSAGFHYVFLTSFGIGVMALISLWFVTDVKGTPIPKRMDFDSFRRFSTPFKLYLVSVLVLSVGSLPTAVLLLKTQSVGLTVYSIPLFYMIYNLSYAGLSVSAGRMSDKLGTRSLIITGYIILVLSYLALYLADSVQALVVSFLMLGLFPAFTDGVQRSHTARLTAEEQRGRGYGWLNAMSGAGVMAAGIGGGYLWQVWSPGTALLISAIIVILGLLLFIAGSRRSGLPRDGIVRN
jgi:MFS family permease